ncbi:MAG: KOW motif-containing protein [Candidatus Acidiferrum sp.]
MKGFKEGEQVRVTEGRYAGRSGVVEGERKGRLLLRLDADGTSTSQPNVALNPELVERQIEVAKER